MEHPVIELYALDRLRELANRRRIVRNLLWELAIAALVLCVIFCFLTNTRNLYKMLLACICVSVGAAWFIIYLGIFVVRDGGRELEHARHLLEGPRQAVTGRVTLEKLKVRIRNSVTLRKVRVDTAEGPVRLNVHIDKTEALRAAGEYLTLYTVHGYVVAYQQAEGGTQP